MTEPIALAHPVTRTRGLCPGCGFRHRLRADGTMGAHPADPDEPLRLCPGTGEPAKPERTP